MNTFTFIDYFVQISINSSCENFVGELQVYCKHNKTWVRYTTVEFYIQYFLQKRNFIFTSFSHQIKVTFWGFTPNRKKLPINSTNSSYLFKNYNFQLAKLRHLRNKMAYNKCIFNYRCIIQKSRQSNQSTIKIKTYIYYR